MTTESPQTHPTLADLVSILQGYLIPTPLWSYTSHIIDALIHIELYRRDAVLQASEVVAKYSSFDDIPAIIIKHLSTLSDSERSDRHRKNSWMIILNLCRAHIRDIICSNRDLEGIQLLRRYFPSSKEELKRSQELMHYNISDREWEELDCMRQKVMAYLKEVSAWEKSLPPSVDQTTDAKRDLYLKKYGDPFRPNGDANLASIIEHRVDRVD